MTERYIVQPNPRPDKKQHFPWRVFDAQEKRSIGLCSNEPTAHTVARQLNKGEEVKSWSTFAAEVMGT